MAQISSFVAYLICYNAKACSVICTVRNTMSQKYKREAQRKSTAVFLKVQQILFKRIMSA